MKRMRIGDRIELDHHPLERKAEEKKRKKNIGVVGKFGTKRVECSGVSWEGWNWGEKK